MQVALRYISDKPALFLKVVVVEEKRKAERRQLMREVHVVTVDDVKLPSAFTLLDISQTGARLKAADMTGLPREFYLMLRSDLMRWCRVAWRNKTQAGVRFIKEPKADAR